MKKHYVTLVVLTLLTSFSAFAQIPNMVSKKNVNPDMHKPIQQNLVGSRNGNPLNHPAAVIWSNDFSVPANWTIGHAAGTTDDWAIGTTTPSGTYAIAPINSTTASNGFALFDSDLLCSHNEIANLTNATAINCTGHANVRLVFEQYYRRFFDSTFVYISNNGTTWTKFPVNASLANAQYVPNPDRKVINISSVAGNQATVYVRFTFYSPVTLGASAGCAYSWMIDDVSVEDIVGDDVAIVEHTFPSQYTLMPLSQAQSFTMSARVTNLGLNAATNVAVHTDVFKNTLSNNVYSNTSSTVASLAVGDTTIAITAGTYTPTDTGLYIVRYIAQMGATDLDHSNDTLYRFVVVNDTLFGRDYSALTGMIDNALGSNTASIRLGQTYNIVTPATIISAAFYLSAPTLGDTVTASIYAFNGSLPTTLIATTPNYYITAADTNGAFLNLSFTAPVVASVGQYVVSVNQVSPIHNITLGFNNDVFTPVKAFYKVGTGAWTTLETTISFIGCYVLRLNLQSTVGINELSAHSPVEIFPNPSTGKVFIHNNDMKGDHLKLNIFNNLGQLVYFNTYSNFQNINVDLSKQPEGIYSFQLTTDNSTISKSVMICK